MENESIVAGGATRPKGHSRRSLLIAHMSSGIIARLPTIPEIRQRTQAVLKRLPCLWQAEVCREQLRGEKDILCIAPTGLGKPLTFWMPLLFREDGIQIVVTPLNLLGTENVAELASHGFRACEVRAETATPKLFQARVWTYLRDSYH